MEKINDLLNKCVSCKTKPCQVGCPLGNDTAGFIKLMKENKYREAYELLCETTVFQSICGRICPHTKQCQGKCVMATSKSSVEIGRLEAYIGDMAIKEGWDIPKFSEEMTNKKVAVVGGGPAGLTCAAFLKRNGIEVTIFEQYNFLGGILSHSIPEFRLDREILQNSLNQILKLGIDVEYGKKLGENISIEELEKEYDAIFLAFGANKSMIMDIEGNSLDGVLGGNELLEKGECLDFINKRVIVVGGGNVAMDVSRTLKRNGAKNVKVIYRRSENEMPAEKKEILAAREDGVEFEFQTNIIKILGNKNVEEIECVKTNLVKVDDFARPVPIDIEGSNFKIKTDLVIMAIGSQIDESMISKLIVDTNIFKNVDENCRTSKEKIFIGGELANGKGSVARAAKSGRMAAYSIKEYLKE